MFIDGCQFLSNRLETLVETLFDKNHKKSIRKIIGDDKILNLLMK